MLFDYQVIWLPHRDKTVVVPAEDVVALEATQCLREWRDKLMELYRVSAGVAGVTDVTYVYVPLSAVWPKR